MLAANWAKWKAVDWAANWADSRAVLWVANLVASAAASAAVRMDDHWAECWVDNLESQSSGLKAHSKVVRMVCGLVVHLVYSKAVMTACCVAACSVALTVGSMVVRSDAQMVWSMVVRSA